MCIRDSFYTGHEWGKMENYDICLNTSVLSEEECVELLMKMCIRDRIDTYLEQIFPFMNVRFIAINDNVDSMKYESGMPGIDAVSYTHL